LTGAPEAISLPTRLHAGVKEVVATFAQDGSLGMVAGLVDPEDHPPFVLGPFLSAGQRSARQAAMAASSRWVARRIGRYTLRPTALSGRLACAEWYRTPDSRSSTAATRAVVHPSPAKPYAPAPRASTAGIRACCSGVSLGVGPGRIRLRSASTPPAAARLSHWLTAPGVTPSTAAIVC
jgi:hypothetical protein